MNKSVLGLVISLLFTVVATTHSFAVEFGEDATGDPNAVKVAGASGFLYSDRIVFTAAHAIGAEDPGAVRYWESEGVIYSPGVVTRAGQKQYKVKKVLVAPTYRPRVGDDQTRIDDFAIIILQESIPMKNEVVVATSDDINLFIKNKTPVLMVGYGFQNPSQRENYEWAKSSPMKMTSYMVSNEELRNYYMVNANMIYKKSNQTILDYGISNSREFGSNCDGDSGAGFFVEKENVRFYLGPAGGSQAGIPNCRNDGSTFFYIGGGMSGITPTFKFINLVKQAESIVAEDKQREFAEAEEIRLAAEAEEIRLAAGLRAEQEAEARAAAWLKAKQESEAKAKAVLSKKTTITCVKGKITKKVTSVNPKCPSGYKKK